MWRIFQIGEKKDWRVAMAKNVQKGVLIAAECFDFWQATHLTFPFLRCRKVLFFLFFTDIYKF